jgi:holin-like protein
MIRGFFILLGFQLLGEALSRGLSLPAPGPVIGLALLVIGLSINRAWRPFDDEQLAKSELGQAAAGLLSMMPLFFVPAGVGVIQYLGLLQAEGVALAAAVVVSTLMTMVVTAVVFVLVKRLIGRRGAA